MMSFEVLFERIHFVTEITWKHLVDFVGVTLHSHGIRVFFAAVCALVMRQTTLRHELLVAFAT